MIVIKVTKKTEKKNIMQERIKREIYPFWTGRRKRI